MSSVQAAERLAALPLFVAQQPDIENPCGFPFVGSTQASARVYHAGVGSADQPSVSWNTRFSARSHSSAEGTTGSCPSRGLASIAAGTRPNRRRLRPPTAKPRFRGQSSRRPAPKLFFRSSYGILRKPHCLVRVELRARVVCLEPRAPSRRRTLAAAFSKSLGIGNHESCG